VGLFERLGKFFTQSDEERLDDEIEAWAERVQGTVRIDSCPSREPVRIAGWVNRLRLRPMNGSTTLEAVISDGTGEVTAAWTGRSSIPGLALGTGIVLEGVLSRDSDERKMVNPRFEFA
jgi:hypothetical protein